VADWLQALLHPVRYNRVTFLAARAFWHGCLREDWTEEQFQAAIREIYALRAGRS
jgi:hypothetical protein